MDAFEGSVRMNNAAPTAAHLTLLFVWIQSRSRHPVTLEFGCNSAQNVHAATSVVADGDRADSDFQPSEP